MILSIKRITKALIRLRVCTGWSAPLLFANTRRQGFSRQGPYVLIVFILFVILKISHFGFEGGIRVLFVPTLVTHISFIMVKPKL